MKIAIVGASGSIGSNLTRFLLEHSTHELMLFSHHAEDIHYTAEHEARLIQINGDILKSKDIDEALEGCYAAVYLVHLMGTKANNGAFTEPEERAARNFIQAANHRSIKRIVYVGGMGNPDTELTAHLHSRQNTGQVLKAGLADLIELHTPMVIGKKAAGFEVIRTIAKFPMLPIPNWANGKTQPIIADDVSRYIAASIHLQKPGYHSFDIGGPEKMTYEQIIKRYATYKSKHVTTFTVPLIPKKLVAFVLRRFKSSNAALTVADMIESAAYSPSTNFSKTKETFPSILPERIEAGFF